MKITTRIPLDQYAYIEIEDDDITMNDAMLTYQEATQQFKGLNDKEFNRVLDRYLTDSQMSDEDRAALGTMQRWWFKTYSNAMKRLTYKLKEE